MLRSCLDSHSSARTSNRVCALVHSRSKSRASTTRATPPSRSASVRQNTQLSAETASGAGTWPGSRHTTGTILLLRSAAWSSSSRHTTEASESGLMTKTNASAPSIASRTSRRHSVLGGMSSQSTQTSRRCSIRRSPSHRTKPSSLREYEMKTSLIGCPALGVASREWDELAPSGDVQGVAHEGAWRLAADVAAHVLEGLVVPDDEVAERPSVLVEMFG